MHTFLSYNNNKQRNSLNLTVDNIFFRIKLFLYVIEIFLVASIWSITNLIILFKIIHTKNAKFSLKSIYNIDKISLFNVCKV